VIEGIGPDDEFAQLLGLLAGMSGLNKDEFLKMHHVDPVRRESLGGMVCWAFSAKLKPQYQRVNRPSVRTVPINWRQSMWIDAETYLPQQARVVIPSEREITVRLGNIVINPQLEPIPLDTFRLPPGGVIINP
jgi:hypothetical protein